MKLLTIKDYLLLINEEAEIKEGDIVVHNFGMGYEIEEPCDKDNLKSNTRSKIIAYYPLNSEAKELDLPLLPPFEEVDIEVIIKDCFGTNDNSKILLNELTHDDLRTLARNGYNHGQVKSKQFSLEDVEDILIKYLEEGFISKEQGYINPKTFLQSLSTQQLPKEFISEIEIFRDFDWNKEEINHIERLQRITNSEGKEVLVGTYKF